MPSSPLWYNKSMGIAIITALALLIICAIVLAKREGLAFSDLLDMLKNRSEYKTSGQGGERFLYRELLKLGIPETQVFRNVYIPVPNKPHKTTELDILVLSKKGILIFEHKTYQGKIYGDGHSKRWLQYYHGKRTFLSPIEQNRYHRACLQEFIGSDIPIYTFTTHSQGGEWHVKNLPPDAHFLSKQGEFIQTYQSLPDCSTMAKHFSALTKKFTGLSRPEDGTREAHIADFGK